METYKTDKTVTSLLPKPALLLLMPLILVLFTRCSLHELPDMEPYVGEFDMTIMEWLPTHRHVDGNGNDFTMFMEALEITGLDELLSGNEQYTLFAPGNIAWEYYLIDNEFDSLQDIPEDELRDILLYHILEGKKLRKDFTPSPEEYESLLDDQFLTVSYQDIIPNGMYYTMLVNARTVLTQDIQFNNGVVHSYGMSGAERGGNVSDVQLLVP